MRSIKHISRNSILISGLFGFIAIAVFVAYLRSNYDAGQGEIVMPLDDVYIHFQYSRQLASGSPYVYNPGLEPTSGATSFIYPYILAFGYLAGFTGLNLGLWSMLIGAVSLFASMWLLYALSLRLSASKDIAVMIPVAFAVTGPTSWHFMSGMETGVIVTATLLMLYALVDGRIRRIALSAVFLALVRPEGSIMVAIAVVMFLITAWRRGDQRYSAKGLGILVAFALGAILLQPLVNYLLTGVLSASGSQAKSLLGIIPRDWSVITERIFDTFIRFWMELATGYSAERNLWYYFPGVSLAVPVGLVTLLYRRQSRWIGITLIAWLIVVSLAISTLDTAFWHFKRYHMPLIALIFLLAAVGFSQIIAFLAAWRKRIASGIVYVVMIVSVALSAPRFLELYKVNIGYVVEQPLSMARWLAKNTPEDARVAVHDVGMMRYTGERTTFDIVGLTTTGAADYWRNGPGAVAEFLLKQKPDYIASYGVGHGYGLYMLAETALYANQLAEFSVDFNLSQNVALAADLQGIYQPVWDSIQSGWIPESGWYIQDFALAHENAYVNVADIASETESQYRWQSEGKYSGFATEARQFEYVRQSGQGHTVIDGTRRFNGTEEFEIDDLDMSLDAVLVTRIHPAHAGKLDIYINDNYLDSRVIFEQPGHWLDLYTLIPDSLVTKPIAIQIVPDLSGGDYMPAHHWLLQGNFMTVTPDEPATIQFQDGAFALTNEPFPTGRLLVETETLYVPLSWYTDGTADGDYRLFVHLYDDLAAPPVAQHDGYVGEGALPPGNWLPGILDEDVNIDISSVESGIYQLAIGFYNPATGLRLTAESPSNQVLPDGRILIGEVEIQHNGR